jgi:hypothetical protein
VTTPGPSDPRGDGTSAPREAPTPDHLLQCAFAFWRSALLLSAHDLGLFAALTAGPHDADTLGARLGLRPDAASDFLEALRAIGLVERHGDCYGHTPETRAFLDPATPAYIGSWLDMASAAMRELLDLSAVLRADDAHPRRDSALCARAWADVAEALRAAGMGDGAEDR